jgi:hypothetical protein
MTQILTPSLRVACSAAAWSGAALALCAGCDTIDSPRTSTAPTVEDVDDDPARYVGKRVTLTGEIDEVHSNQAFELEGHGWIFDDEVLVVTRTPVRLGAAQLSDDLEVRVSGIVRKMSPYEIEREVGWDVNTHLEARWRDKAVVVADDISALQRVANWSEKESPRGTVVSLWTIYQTPTPADFADSEIELEGVEVADKGERGMFIGFGGEPEIFVEPERADAITDIKVGQRIDVKGTLKRLPPPSEAEKKWQLSGTQRELIEADALYIDASAIAAAKQKPTKAGDPTATR